jgi:membrane associated rhomboid family serine protease
MNLNFYNQGGREQKDGNAMVWYLIIANVILFFLGSKADDLALYCNRYFRFWQPVTAGFLHLEFFHLFFNMYSIYLFGTLVAPHIGKRDFLLLYLISALAGNLLFLALNWGSPAILVGASGAAFGIMAAAALLEPDRRFTLLFLPFKPLKTTTLVICFAIVEILLQLTGIQSGIAHLAHLGGLAGGYLFIKLKFPRMIVWDIFRKRVRNVPFEAPPEEGPRKTGRVTSDELDALLDKISRYGINSLSEHELARLRQAREEMRGK